MSSFRLPIVVFMVLATVLAWADDPLRMDLSPTFQGTDPNTSVVTVTLENDGPDAKGVLSVQGEGGPVQYPVELPQGARKRIFTFPTVLFGDIEFTLLTNRGNIRRKMPSELTESSYGSVAYIGDESGGLAFLRKVTVKKQTVQIRDAYVKPEDAPERPSAYSQFNSVMLGAGAERMTNQTVTALRDYILAGGSVVFFGGASAPVLEDPRWQDLLPGRGWKPVSLPAGTRLPNATGVAVPAVFTVLRPDEFAAGTVVTRSGGEIVSSSRGFGAGQVVVLGYSPVEPPLNTWGDRIVTVNAFARSVTFRRAQAVIRSFSRTAMDDEAVPVGFTPAGSTTTTWSFAGRSRESADPFSTKLPDTNSVFGILLVYFVLVVPVSFLLLKRLKRGELAWITAPVLALAFAGLLFKSAESLYSAALSTATQGALVTQEGDPNGVFVGNSQIFFPRGGVYDLKLQDVDRLSPVSRDDYAYSGYPGSNEKSLAGFNLVDVGTVIAPRVEASNLAFREMSYVQRFPAVEWFQFEVVDRKHLKVSNLSTHAFSGDLTNGPYRSKGFTLAPGESKSVPIATGPVVETKDLGGSDTRWLTRSNGRIALSGIVEGFRPGPQIGKEVARRSEIYVIAFAKARLNAKNELTLGQETQ
jgi:hypothetical protein